MEGGGDGWRLGEPIFPGGEGGEVSSAHSLVPLARGRLLLFLSYPEDWPLRIVLGRRMMIQTLRVVLGWFCIRFVNPSSTPNTLPHHHTHIPPDHHIHTQLITIHPHTRLTITRPSSTLACSLSNPVSSSRKLGLSAENQILPSYSVVKPGHITINVTALQHETVGSAPKRSTHNHTFCSP